MLKDQIQQDIISAMKAKDETTVSVLRMVSAAVKNYEIAKERDYIATDKEVEAVIQKEAKKRREAIAMYNQGNRQDLVDKESEELNVLKHYLPEQMSDEELESIVKQAITQTGAKGASDMGKVMGAVMSKAQGKADGKRVGAIAQKLLNS